MKDKTHKTDAPPTSEPSLLERGTARLRSFATIAPNADELRGAKLRDAAAPLMAAGEATIAALEALAAEYRPRLEEVQQAASAPSLDRLAHIAVHAHRVRQLVGEVLSAFNRRPLQIREAITRLNRLHGTPQYMEVEAAEARHDITAVLHSERGLRQKIVAVEQEMERLLAFKDTPPLADLITPPKEEPEPQERYAQTGLSR